MPTGAKISAQDTTITFNGAEIGNLISFSAFNGQAADIDDTTLASVAMEYAPGLQDNGEVTIDLFRDNADSGQAAVLTALAAQSVEPMTITFNKATTDNVFTFDCYVKSMDIKGGVNERVKGTLTVKVTGPIVVTDSTP